MTPPNILFVTLDQFRADALSLAAHPLVETPHLDALARHGTWFANHYAQAAPCAPGRAALYTGTYQMNNRVVANGTPLDDRFDNVARMARRAGHQPVLFGYTDQGVDPRLVDDPSDPRLSTYEGILPGFEVGLDLPGHSRPWLEWLDALGYHVRDAGTMLASEAERPAEHSISAFLTDRMVEWLSRAEHPFLLHASYLRPHPPFSAPGEYATRYAPEDCPPPVPATPEPDWLHAALLRHPLTAGPTDPGKVARMQAQYFGLVTHVDQEVGRLLAALDELGLAANTVVVVTSDHGEQLGDQGLREKCGYFPSSYAVPLIVADPRKPAGQVVRAPTEAVDVLPTLSELLEVPVPLQCDGLPLTPWLEGEDAADAWRRAVHYEWDWRDTLIPRGEFPWPTDRRLEHCGLVVQLGARRAYVQFGNGDALGFDVAADPTWRTPIEDPAVLLAEAQQMLAWRAQHTERTMTGYLLREGGIGRRPPEPAGDLVVSRRGGTR
ncbi:MAG TPA: sulfatase-like hydrolase/transferase [Acidimicrobiales bacterium]|nr:sulfatase-like hydrolase/transferase [Acidimicrobiales bacterium]